MRIFRKIRRTLIQSGKTRNYLLYAFGEIVLIVIGILIAWKINDLNEIRKNKIVELKIYQSLNEELDSNLKILDSSIYRYTENIKSISNTIRNIGLQPEEISEDLKSDIVLVNYRITQLHDGAINSINSTNKFEFIQSVLLKDLIASYPNELDNFKSQEAVIENIITNRLKPEIEEHISLLDIVSNRDIGFKTSNISVAQSNYINLLNSRAYQNALVDRLIQTEIQLENSIGLRDKTKIISSKLNAELGA
ncbi:hypothetical protein [Lacinutrix venerupis]|uniref:Uncharacterized protein n=1 Tax=Lacinutrix venerupis TaxID=1486034 RepID=A0AAC9LR33_9FLAO|nr:hypothetical protein [Lacinutrix venerupis]APY01472.1 hypothetical protein BWR22_05615 [Lacinutrix venerupis]